MHKNNQIKLAGVAACCVAVFVGSYMGTSNAATQLTNADIEIVAAVSIAKNADLDFGAVAKPTAASVVTMSTAGTRTLDSGDATLISNDAGFNADYDITSLSGEAVELSIGTVVDPDPNIVLDPTSFKASVAGGGDLDIGAGAEIYTSTGTDNVDVGASVNIAPAVTAGTYQGTYELNADYQ